jgi:hypothetical protein
MSYPNNADIPNDFDEEEDIFLDDFDDIEDELLDESQEEELDELGEYSDDELDPEEVLYGDGNTDFDYAYYDNADEWEGIEDQDEV